MDSDEEGAAKKMERSRYEKMQPGEMEIIKLMR